MTDGDRLRWIFETDPTELESRYDQWAATYDSDHADWGWLGPELVADAALRLGTETDPGSTSDEGQAANASIYDAGCGTGKAGVALRRAGWLGGVVGLDFSKGMLDVAADSGAYTDLIKCSVLDLPLHTDVAHGVVSSGVFTHGHVGGEAFGELARITKPGGTVSVTQRLDIEEELRPHAETLEDRGVWTLIERAEPRSLHPDRDSGEQTVTTWRVS